MARVNRNDLPAELIERPFKVGTTIEHGCYRGTVVGLNARDLVMDVRVTAVARGGPASRIGRVIEVPFDRGRPV
jgi:hypothetical protein